MEPIEYLRALIRRWPIIAVCAFIGAGFAFVGTDPEPEPIRTTYQATHTLLTSANEFGTQAQIGTITFAQVPVFATTGEVPRLVAEDLGYNGPPAALAAEVTVVGDATTGTLRFSSEQDDPEEAVRIADAFAEETVRYLALRQEELRQDRQTKALSDVGRLEAEIRELDEQLASQIAAASEGLEPSDPRPQADSVTQARRDTAVREYNAAYESYRALIEDDGSSDLNLTTLERAQPVSNQSGGFTAPRTRATRVPIAAAIGALFGAAIALLAERLDSKIRDRRRAEEYFDASVIAELPSLSRRQRSAGVIVGPDQHSGATEAFRSLRTSLTFMTAGGEAVDGDDRVGVVLITSPGPGEGKTTTAVNLAAAFAETGRTVVLVNADFRRPTASRLVADERPPLPAGPAGIDRLEPDAFLSPTKLHGVRLLDLSPLAMSPGDLTRATYRLVGGLRDHVDVLVIDTPPLSVTTEALEFVPLADAVLLMGRVGRTSTAAARRAGELVRFGGAQRVAIALAGAGSGRRRRSTYYDYYGGGTGKRRRKQRGPRVVEPEDPESSHSPEVAAVDGEAGFPPPAIDGSGDWGDLDEVLGVTGDEPVAPRPE